MPSVTEVKASDIPVVNDLLQTAFGDGIDVRYIFREDKLRQRWTPRILGTTTDIVSRYGLINGVRIGTSSSFGGVAQWFLPCKRFPPRWYHTIRYLPRMLPLSFMPTTAKRYNRIHALYYSMLPRKKGFLYLSGLAVHPDCRNQQIGTRLMNWGLDYATRYESQFFLHCWEPLVPYYERFGFVTHAYGTLDELGSTCHGMLWDPANKA